MQPFDDILHSPEEINNFVVTRTSDCIESYQCFFDDALQKLLKLNRGGSIVCVLNHCESSGKGGNSYAEFQRIVMKSSKEARSHGICVNGAVYQVSSWSVEFSSLNFSLRISLIITSTACRLTTFMCPLRVYFHPVFGFPLLLPSNTHSLEATRAWR